jgi:UDP-N-acetylglucosamine 2-epimerase (non-hydrolysing)
MQLTIVAGARPNFMKIAPIIHAIGKEAQNKIKFRLIHTGQHYDKNMSDNFFEQLSIPNPDANLSAGGGTQAEQTAAIMIAFEKELIANPCDAILVVGDVTSTLACSIVAKKLNIDVIHVEGGIRSGDRTMPEEINRLVTDSITDHFFTTSVYANQNLIKEGIPEKKIHFVGNTMIDTLLANKDKFKQPLFWNDYGLKKGNYLVLTLHRPANVDDAIKLRKYLDTLIEYSHSLPIVFPVHPRTRKNIELLNMDMQNIILVDPQPYFEFNYLVENCKLVITDSGGITEETTVMGIPCMTLRDNTERYETVSVGTNELIGTNPDALIPAFEKLWKGEWKKGTIPELWDGNTSERIVKTLINIYG